MKTRGQAVIDGLNDLFARDPRLELLAARLRREEWRNAVPRINPALFLQQVQLRLLLFNAEEMRTNMATAMAIDYHALVERLGAEVNVDPSDFLIVASKPEGEWSAWWLFGAIASVATAVVWLRK